MDGDVVKILTNATEENGIHKYSVEIGEKPHFMLDEEYNATLITCIINAVKETCNTIYPENRKAQENCIKGIMTRALN